MVGGTGLALQIGHRKSDDIDLFTLSDFNQEELLQNLESDFNFQLDFIDLYYLLHDFDVEQLLKNYGEKYQLRNAMHALKSLNYFDDVITEDWPEIIRDKELKWDTIMEKIDDSCYQFIKSRS